jgi:hypothetical protein
MSGRLGLLQNESLAREWNQRQEMRHWLPKPTCTTEFTNKTKTNLGGYAGEECREEISVDSVFEHEASPARGPE